MKAAHPEVVAAPRVNPGETLRKARESRGWTVAQVAEQLNLTPQRLTQIEQGAFDQLPGHTFARGYVRAYGKLLEIDQARLVQEFDQFTGSDAAGASVHSLGHIEEPVSYSQGVLRGFTFVLLVALAGLGYYWWQEQAERRAEHLSSTSIEHVEVEGADGTTQIHALDEPEDQAVADAQGEAEELLLPGTESEASANADAAAPVGASPEAAAVPTAPVANAAAPTAPVAAVPVPAAVTAAPAPAAPNAAAPAPAAQPVVAGPGEGQVGINFVADCWTQVTDANGKVLFSGLKRKGDSLQVAGKAPLELRLGYARGAQVSFNGGAFDVAPFISGETARIKLGGQ
ncbi:helix-turn-helix domain-containing protein [Pseudomonas sp. 5P_3.1_Bac2]|uniref:RodZ domain-containing protein n=1 Tax=Pseudomonas sp. 5P_3.1_Bac2 TaxID=2971617 RepID=UPI0021C92BCC|nr:RodZ family helix-turn-helix domain-containing protein [Pseudomonas sp. 5P_3.1_Bac2]MCU1719562.1 helix-turn-helix domain-containing protein [Pseudomonas sp. 5P_3.1_Bac2]